MRIIPVLDLMGGCVVRGVQGDRARYEPVKSILTTDCTPLAVARGLWAETDCDTLYLADLDAIEGQGHHQAAIEELSTTLPIHLWVDGGVADVKSAARWMEAGVHRVVIGSETLSSLQALDTLQVAFPAERFVFSLDMRQGKVLSRSPDLHDLEPLALLEILADRGWTTVILLTLDRVGAGSGPDWMLLEQARHRFPNLELIAGGGVQGIQDLHRLSRLGARGVLVASALHNGRLTKRHLHTLTSQRADPENAPDPGPRSGIQTK
jgi:phosphoribosylformimino-5-aminoimidazole carboxamide ribotide isomerase